ncbi:MAG: hypothetical protein ACKO1Y_06310 [Actinomycetota bacterium]
MTDLRPPRRLRNRLARSVPALLLGLCLLVAPAARVGAAPALPDNERAPAAARWIVASLSPAGLLPSPMDPSQPSATATAQAVSALVASGADADAVAQMLDALAPLVDEIATEGGTDSAGGLGTLIAAVVAGGLDPRSFGSPAQDLVARLEIMRQPDGRFGSADPTYDGAFRQSLALLALAAAGTTDSLALDWLEEQQCASGLWTAYRADTSVPCPPGDADTYAGPDSNSTALAIIALAANGRTAPAATGATALRGSRNADGGWGFILETDMASDASSTALAAIALRMASGAADPTGLEVLATFQVDCSAAGPDRGGVAYQAGPDGSLVPDANSTAAALIAFAGGVLPVAPRELGPPAVDPCPEPTPVTTAAPATSTTVGPAPTAATLPRTGPSNLPSGLGFVVLGVGLALVLGSRRR